MAYGLETRCFVAGFTILNARGCPILNFGPFSLLLV